MMTQIIFIPAHCIAAHLSLDNSLFHDWSQRVRKQAPWTNQAIGQVMADEWNKLPTSLLKAHYNHCGLAYGEDPYFDCPAPFAHKHKQS